MKKLTYKHIKKQIESVEGYRLLSKSYKNNSTKLKIQCNKNHIYNVTYSHFQRGQRCSYCNKLSYKFVKEQIESVEGYKLLSKTYVNVHTKINIQCNKGHTYKVTYANFQQGQRCQICAGLLKHTYKFIKEQIESVEGYKLLSTKYINNGSKLSIQCNKGHTYKVTYANFQQGRRCPICNHIKITSKAEKEVFNIVKSITNKNVIANDRTQVVSSLTNKNLELDIWIPSLNKAIEFNGRYWHSFEETKIRDNEKVKQCKEKGINLLVINEQDWINNKMNEINKIQKWI